MAIAYTYPSVTVQQLVFTAKRWGQFPSITYKNGGTAGSEVVTMDSSFNITIQIQSGTSTNAQIAAALAAATASNGLGAGDLCSAAPVSGHSADTPTCTVLVPLAGGVTAAVAATAAIGSLLYTAATAGTGGNAVTVQYVDVVPVTIGTVTDGTHLVITSNANMIVGATLTQGANTTTITTVTDATHIIVGATAGFTAAAAQTSVIAGGEKVKVTSNAILVQIANFASSTNPVSPSGKFPVAGVDFTTPVQIITAIAGSGAAAALVTATKNPSINSVGVRTSVAASAVSLAGGLAAAPAAVTVNGLTITSATNNAAQNGLTITLTDGATAGAEVVTLDGSNNVSVQIQGGTSTVTQVRTALQAAGAFTALFTATGTSATAMQAPYQKAMSGAAGPNIYGWYVDGTSNALTTSFVYFPFSGVAEDFLVYNDETTGSKQVIGSWDGVNNHFIVLPGTTSGPNTLNMSTVKRSGVFLKQANGAPAYRAMTVNR